MLRLLCAIFGMGCLAVAARTLTAAEPVRLTIRVGENQRTALAFFPETVPASGSPVVFIFHGHGGSAESSVKGFDIQAHWPEAICIYMQGLLTPSKLDPEGKQAGWQRAPGEQDNRDIKFFDAMLAELRAQHKIDNRRIYVTGFSNGGFFTYALWAARGNVLAAVAPCACSAGDNLKFLKPKPCLHLTGNTDRVVGSHYQLQTIAAIRRLNGCDETGVAWNTGPRMVVTYYPSPTGTPFVSAIHIGGHIVPKSTGAWVVRFFKEQAMP